MIRLHFDRASCVVVALLLCEDVPRLISIPSKVIESRPTEIPYTNLRADIKGIELHGAKSPPSVLFQLPRQLRGRVLPVQEPVHVGWPEVPERRDVQRGDVADARADLPMLLPHRLHGQLLRDRRALQRVQGQPVPERRHLHTHQPLGIQVHVSARLER